MPPKVPNSKFKPKLVSRAANVSRNEANETTSQGTNANTLSGDGGASSHDGSEAAGGISSVHLRRLQQRIASGADAALGEMLGSSQPPHAGGSALDSSSTAAGGGASAGRGAGGGGGRGQSGGRHASAASFSSAYMSQLKRRQQEADLDDDLNDMSEMLPVNSMSRILMEQHIESQSAIYRPVPLESSNAMSSLQPHANAQQPQGQQGGHTESTLDGHAFLQEHLRELERRHQANKQFFLSMSSSGNGNADESGTSTATARGEESDGNNNLVWLQLPRFHHTAPVEGDGASSPSPPSAPTGTDSTRKASLSLAELPTGKVGEMKVYKSGRVVLEINGVFYDVNAESLFGVHGDGSCNTAAAILPGQQRSSDERAGCYELGILKRKLICAPTWSTESYQD